MATDGLTIWMGVALEVRVEVMVNREKEGREKEGGEEGGEEEGGEEEAMQEWQHGHQVVPEQL